MSVLLVFLWFGGLGGWSRCRRVSASARAAPARQFGAERIEMRHPEAPERIEPRVSGFERCGVDRIHPSGSVGPDGREPRLPQHAQMLRDSGLRDRELALHDIADVAGALLAARKHLEDAP